MIRQVADPEGAGRRHEVLLPQREKLGPHETRGAHPAGQSDDDHDVVNAGRKERHDRQDEEEAREAEHDVDEPHDERIDLRWPACRKRSATRPRLLPIAPLSSPPREIDRKRGVPTIRSNAPCRARRTPAAPRPRVNTAAMPTWSGGHGTVPIVTGDAAQNDPDEHRDTDRHKPDRQRDPGSLHHAGKHIPSEVIGPEEIKAETGASLRERVGGSRCGTRGGRSFSSSRTTAGSKIGFGPDVRASPARARREKRERR